MEQNQKNKILETAIKIGLDKGYRMDFPEDWYDGFEIDEFRKFNIFVKKIKKHFVSSNDIIRTLFPNFVFFEWRFKRVRDKFWSNNENIIYYLKWLGKEMNWNSPEDWYNLTCAVLRQTGGLSICRKNRCRHMHELPKYLYPNYNFDVFKFNTLPVGYFDDFNVLKNILMNFNKQQNRMPTYIECIKLGIQSGIIKHGGHDIIASKLGFSTSFQMKTLSGNLVKSSCEVIFDNFCFLNKIPYEYEVNITKNRRFKCDFKINDIFFEIWGGWNGGERGSNYAKIRKEKENIYNIENIRHIGLESKIFNNYSLSNINEFLILLMKDNNIKQDNFYSDDLQKLCTFDSFTKRKAIEEIKQECEKRGFSTCPTFNWMVSNGFSKHVLFLRKTCKMSMYDIAEECELNNARKPANYWKDFNNVKYEILKISKEIDKFPSNRYLANVNPTLGFAIIEYHGGSHAVQLAMGFVPEKVAPGSWANWEFFKQEYLPICEKIGHFASSRYLKTINRTDISGAIRVSYGGFIKIKDKLKQEGIMFK